METKSYTINEIASALNLNHRAAEGFVQGCLGLGCCQQVGTRKKADRQKGKGPSLYSFSAVGDAALIFTAALEKLRRCLPGVEGLPVEHEAEMIASAADKASKVNSTAGPESLSKLFRL